MSKLFNILLLITFISIPFQFFFPLFFVIVLVVLVIALWQMNNMFPFLELSKVAHHINDGNFHRGDSGKEMILLSKDKREAFILTENANKKRIRQLAREEILSFALVIDGKAIKQSERKLSKAEADALTLQAKYDYPNSDDMYTPILYGNEPNAYESLPDEFNPQETPINNGKHAIIGANNITIAIRINAPDIKYYPLVFLDREEKEHGAPFTNALADAFNWMELLKEFVNYK